MEKFAGSDWASDAHALCVIDESGARLRERIVDHSQAGSRSARSWSRCGMRGWRSSGPSVTA